jgi:PAS domain S-box-containing protein
MKSVSNQVFASIILSLSIILGGWIFYRVKERVNYETKRVNEIQVLNAEQIANYLSYPMGIQNKSVVDDNLQNEVSDKYVTALMVFDTNGKLYASAFDQKKNLISSSIKLNSLKKQDSIVRTILYQKKVIGKVVLYGNKEPLETLLNSLKIKLYKEFFILIFITALIQFFILRRLVIKPLISLKKWIKKIDSDNKLAASSSYINKEIETIKDPVLQLKNRLILSLEENSNSRKEISDKESLITAISKNLPEGMIYRLITKGTEYRKFVYLGGSFEKMYGYSPEEGMDDPMLVFNRVYRADVQSLFAIEAEAAKTMSTFKCEVRMVNQEGIIRTSRFVSTPSLMEDGSICWDGIELDITDLKKTEAELQYNQFLLKSIAEGSPDNIFAKDLNGNYIFTNSAVAKRINKTQEEILGIKNNAFFTSDEAKRTMRKDLEIMESGVIQTFEEKLTHCGKEGTFLTTKGPLKDAQGKTIGLFGIARDITDIKKAKEDLRQNQFLLQSITEGLPDSIFAKDLNGNYLFVNSAFAKRTFKKPEELVGKNNTDVISIEQANKATAIDLEIIESENTLTAEDKLTTASGDNIFLVTKGPIKDAYGKVVGIFGIARDITELREREEALRISQERFQFAFNSSPNAILIQDEESGRYMDANASNEKIFGYSKNEVITKTPLELNYYKDPAFREKVYEALKENGNVQNMEVLSLHKSGKDLHVLLSMERHYVNDKPILYVNIQDVTERKLTEDKLRKRKAQYQSIIAVSNTGAWEYYSDTSEFWFSTVYYKMLGITKEEFETDDSDDNFKRMLDLIHPDDYKYSKNSFQDYLKNGSVGVYEDCFRMKHASGKWIWIWSRAETVRDNEGNLTKLTVGTHIDITQVKQAELELQKLNLDKDRFISILGHDLRGPVNGIVGMLELLQMDDMSIEEIKEINDLVYRSAKNTSNLLDDVLLWATAQSGKMNFNPQKINFKQDCSDIIALVQSLANTKNIAIELYSDEALTVNADKNMLDTVLRNLISNAIKFTKEDGKVIVSTQKNIENTIISVVDNGIGISSSDIDKIFDKSLLFTSIGTNEEKGTGFGLKLCQDFIEKHGGNIWVESEEEKGTTFNFSLPNVY